MEVILEKLEKYKANINIVAKINLEYTEKLGKEHHMAILSNTLVNAMNQFEKFINIMEDKEAYIDEILLFSSMTIDVFKITPSELIETKNIFKKKKIMKKNYEENKDNINLVLDQMDKISKMIDENVGKIL